MLTVVGDRVTAPALILIVNPLPPIDNATPEIVSAPVAVEPSPMVIPAMLVVPVLGWRVNVVELKRAVSSVRLFAGAAALQLVFVAHVVLVTPVHFCSVPKRESVEKIRSAMNANNPCRRRLAPLERLNVTGVAFGCSSFILI